MFLPLNNLLNCVDRWTQEANSDNVAQGSFKRDVATRLATSVVGTSLDVAAVAKNVLVAMGEGVAMVPRVAVNTFSILTGSDLLAAPDAKLPTVQQFLETVLRVIYHAIGAFSSITLGVISPSANFALHCALGLSENTREKQAQELATREVEQAAEKNAQELAKKQADLENAKKAKQAADKLAKQAAVKLANEAANAEREAAANKQTDDQNKSPEPSIDKSTAHEADDIETPTVKEKPSLLRRIFLKLNPFRRNS